MKHFHPCEREYLSYSTVEMKLPVTTLDFVSVLKDLFCCILEAEGNRRNVSMN